MNELTRSVVSWKDCVDNPPNTYADAQKAIVAYIYSNPERGIEFLDWCEAKWNGMEWLAVDGRFPAEHYTTMMWAKPECPFVDMKFRW